MESIFIDGSHTSIAQSLFCEKRSRFFADDLSQSDFYDTWAFFYEFSTSIPDLSLPDIFRATIRDETRAR